MECDQSRTKNPDLQQGCKINFGTQEKGILLNDIKDPLPDSCWDGGSKFYI